MTDAHLSLDGLTGPASPAARTVQGERQASDVAGRPLVGRKAGIGVIIAGAGIACGAILLGSTHPTVDPHDAAPKPAIMAQQTYVAPVRVPEPAKPLPPNPQPLMPRDQPTAIDPPTESRAASKLLVYSAGGNTGAGGMRGYGPSSPDPEPGSAAPHVVEGLDGSSLVGPGSPRDGLRSERGDDLGSRLTPTRLTGVSASVLRHQPYLLTTGTMIPCILQTAMDSTLPGLVTCVVPQDIMGKTGLTLLDRGTRIVGEFRGGVRQGIERMFVVWSRAETPQGVVIALDSPATDPLGRSGMDGEVDRHFWERFGGALLMTTVNGAIQAGVAQASQAGTVTLNTGSTETVIDDALRGSVDLPPTIRKNQGELVSILVARDLDFASVYRVRPTPGMGR